MVCDRVQEIDVAPPPGWTPRYSFGERKGFCAAHADVKDFADSQCPGCVSSFGDECPLFKRFAYSESRTIARADLESIESGICPARVNGTFFAGGGKARPVDISDRAPLEAGKVLATAIRAYCDTYPTRPR
jgi:hypothetical protein